MTMFFSGGVLQPVFAGEDRIVDFASVSENVADKFPLMNASLVTDAVIKGIQKNTYKLIACTFANVDATDHTGNVTAVRMAAEFVDTQIAKIRAVCEENGYTMIITADHGNGEEDSSLDDSPQLYHKVNNVPFIAVTHDFEIVRLRPGQTPYIGNVAASVLTVLGMDIPREMEPSILRPVGIHVLSSPTTSRYDFFIGFCFALVAVILGGLCLRLTKGTCTRREPLRDYRSMGL
jgi:2,3-bisphosphoglycerate-independent phosphoglycerate mutase